MTVYLSLPKYPRLGYLCVPTIHAQGLVAVLLCISHTLLSRVWFYYALAKGWEACDVSSIDFLHIFNRVVES